MIRAMTTVLTMAAAMAAPAAAAEGQFNLNCVGTLQTITPFLLRDDTKPIAEIYRIDLDAKKWCSAECSAQFDIVAVTPTSLLLEDKNVDTPREHEKMRSFISRETGDLNISAESGIGPSRLSMYWKEQCSKAPFTGFPKPETKF